MNRKQVITFFTCIVLVLAMASGAAAQGKKGAKKAEPAKAAPAAAAAAKAEAVSNAASNPDALDLNTATLEKLMTLNGVDIVVAKKIAAARPFKDKKDLVAKKILTAEAFNKIVRGVTVKAPEKAGKK